MSTDALSLLVRAGRQLCALPLEHVAETMRRLEVRAIARVPPFVLGVAVIRGVPVPVVDALSVVAGGEPSAHVTRLVTLKAGDRLVALAVDQVIGVTRTDPSKLSPLLTGACHDVVSALGTLDTELLAVLRTGTLVPEDAWTMIEAGATS